MSAAKKQKDTRQRFPKYLEILSSLMSVRNDYPCEFSFACDVFESFVEPSACWMKCPSPQDIERMNAAFSEWFLYDFDIFEGLTLFEVMAEDDPSLEECASTQFYSRFWVLEQDPERDRAVLRDTSTRFDYVVRSPHIAQTERWATGTLGTRIARVHGVWREIGQVALHDNAESKPLPGRKGKKGAVEHDPAAFIVNVQQVIGRNGKFASTVTD